MVEPNKPKDGKSSRTNTSAGELSGLLRKAESLQRELEKAEAELQEEQVSGADSQNLVRVQMSGHGAPVTVEIEWDQISDAQRAQLRAAVQSAVAQAIDRLFELRKARLGSVTRSINLPNLYS